MIVFAALLRGTGAHYCNSGFAAAVRLHAGVSSRSLSWLPALCAGNKGLGEVFPSVKKNFTVGLEV